MGRLSIPASSYQLVNILVVIIIGLVFLYSAIFNSAGGGYPVECVHVTYAGQVCPTCGLSCSFSEMIRGNYAAASDYNRSGPLLFLFFAIQLLMRITAGTLVFRINATKGGACIPGRKGKTGRTESAGHQIGDESLILVPEKAKRDAGVSGRLKTVAVTDAVISVILFLLCFRHLLLFWHSHV